MPDPAAGKYEFPGGHCEGDERPRQAAVREWQEETGLKFPDGDFTGTWTSPDGVYQGFVYTIACEADLDIFDRQLGSDPDGDGDGSETIGWWDPADLPDNPAVRAELLADIDAVLSELGRGGAGAPSAGDESVCPCDTPVVYDEANGWQHADGSISHDDGESVSDKMHTLTKAASPKGDAPAKGASADWPGWQHDEAAATYWAGQIASGLKATLTVTAAEKLARDYLAQHQLPADGSKPDRARLTAETSEWLAARQLDLAGPLAKILPKMHADGYLIGLLSAKAAAAGKKRLKLDGWTPGDTDRALRAIADNEADEDYGQLADDAPGAAQHMADTRHDDLVRILVAGLLAGATVLVLGRSLRDSLGSLSTALGIAITEITRSSGLAALVGYRQAGVTQGQWVLDPGVNTCPICIGNAGASSRPIGAAYPSGNAYPPVHPRCRCSVIPA